MRICPICWRDWTLFGSIRKFTCLAIAALVLMGLSPIPVRSQNPDLSRDLAAEDHVRIEDLGRRVDRIDVLPERTSVIEANLKQVKEQVDTLNTRAWFILAAAAMALFERILSVFGVKIRDRVS